MCNFGGCRDVWQSLQLISLIFACVIPVVCLIVAYMSSKKEIPSKAVRIIGGMSMTLVLIGIMFYFASVLPYIYQNLVDGHPWNY